MRIPNKKMILLCLSVCLLSGLFAAENTVEMISDPLKLVIYPNTGNFCLYHSKADDARAYEPLYDDRSQSSVNLYSVFFNGEIFPLNNKSGNNGDVPDQHGFFSDANVFVRTVQTAVYWKALKSRN